MADLILVALSTFAADDRSPLDLLAGSGTPYRIHASGKRITRDELVRDGADATVIVAGVESYDAAVLAQLPALRCISRCGVGVDAIDHTVARRRGVVIANTPGIPTSAVAELALSMMLSLSRNLHRQAALMRQRHWERLTSHLMEGRTVGIIGLGNIGLRVAQLCRAFNAKILACDPRLSEETEVSPGILSVSMERLLRESDIISIHATKPADQKPLIGAAELAITKSGVLLINLARGGMIDEGALADALDAGHIAGAGLDVFSTEPYQGPLCGYDQVILTPHNATTTVETRVQMETMCIRNALDFLSGRLSDERRISL
jgi:D-3-phosphoglycerate dehydrogenase